MPTLQQVTRGYVSIDSVIHSEAWRGYQGLVDFGNDKHFQVHHGEHEFARGNTDINGIESFALCLKKTQFRFSYRQDNLYKLLLRTFRTGLL